VGEVAFAAPGLSVRTPSTRYLVEKGSVAVDGVSLTVVDVADDRFTVAVIPHTADATTLGRRRPGDRVNLEYDLVAKYVERLMESR
jgi:riboflavin synthase